MSFNNIWFLLLLLPLLIFFIKELYLDKKEDIFYYAAENIKKQNYSRFNHSLHTESK